MTGPNRKIALAIRSDLESWQKLNVAAFVTSGFASAEPTIVGEPYVDGDGRQYPPLLAYPVRVYGGDEAGLRRCFNRATERGLLVSVYTNEMFATMNDEDNRAVVAAASTSELPLAGFAVAGDPKQVDKAFDKLKLHE